MSITHKLDMAIKLAETGSVEGGYHIGGSVKDTYMSNSEWEAFKAEMSAQAIAELSAGGGDNLSEKGARPPKMASFGSAARMVYTLSRHKYGFHFENKLPSTVGASTVINGFCDDGYRYIFVWDFFFTIIANVLLIVVYCRWKRYGGDKNYVPPQKKPEKT